MDDTLLTIVLAVVFIIGPFWLISRMDKGISKKGALFTGRASPGMRILAVLVGLIFGGMFVVEYLGSDTINLLYPVLALALFGYGLGKGKMLKKLQKEEEGGRPIDQPPPSNEPVNESLDSKVSFLSLMLQYKPMRIWIILVVGLPVSALVLYGAAWAAANPGSLFSKVFVIGVILLIVLVVVLERVGLLGQLFRKKSDRE